MADPTSNPVENPADKSPPAVDSLPNRPSLHRPQDVPRMEESDWVESPALRTSVHATGKGGDDPSIVLPEKRNAKAGPKVKVKVVESVEPKESHRFVDRDGGGGRSKDKPEVIKVGEKQEKSWQNQRPHFRPVPEHNISFGAVVRLFSDLELTQWTKNHLPSKKLIALVVCAVGSVILAGHIWNYGFPGWLEQRVLGRDPTAGKEEGFVRYERADPIGETKVSSGKMDQFVAKVDQLFESRDEAEGMLANYCSIHVAEDILYFVRQEIGIEELVRTAGAPKLAPKDWRPGIKARWVVRTTSSTPYALLGGRFPSGEEYQAYFLIERGQLIMDWKATTAYSTATFEELINGEGDPSEIRCWLVPDVYFNGPYDEKLYKCYKVVSPPKSHTIWCYVEKGTPIAEQLDDLVLGGQIVRNREGYQQLTLKLKEGPEGSMPNQWMIEEVISDDWVRY